MSAALLQYSLTHVPCHVVANVLTQDAASLIREQDQRSGWLAECQTPRECRIPPHLFRDAAATTLARSSAQSARLIRPVLAHSGFKTAERHYIHAQTIDAGRDYASLVNRLKGDQS